MSGFDDYGISYTEPYSQQENLNETGYGQNTTINEFQDFIMRFQNMRLEYVYRDQLKKNYNLNKNFLQIDLQDLSYFNEKLSDLVIENPTEYLSLFEKAARLSADEITYPRPPGQEKIQDIQILLNWSCHPCPIRDLKSDRVSKLVKISGVIVNVSTVRVRAQSLTLQCRSCRATMPNVRIRPGMDGYCLPRKCPSSSNSTALKPQCPLDPFFVVSDKCACVDSQLLKLQEMPDSTPTGEMPRHLQLYCERNLVECVTPGNKVTVIGVFSIKKASARSDKGLNSGIGIRKPYLRVVGIEHSESPLDGRLFYTSRHFTPEEIEEFQALAARKDAYEVISRSIAPSIFGGDDIKKAVACLLFGGSAIKLPDGLTSRGDIHVLLLGDPGTAKSQLLKFIEKAAPIGLYTSGKGSSAAGLTAAVNKDSNGGFIIEGGALVLGDGGCVCIDEFDKMREDDRVAIHEAMEQQTISISKAGITTNLNARCSILAAANSVFGRWDDLKGGENINFMPTILSRFDMIFVVKDEHDEEKDMRTAKHVVRIHMESGSLKEQEGELSISFLRKYIDYCRQTCGPRLSPKAAERLKLHYIKVRASAQAQEKAIGKKSPIIITVRQLEAICRIGEALAKMRLQPFVSQEHIEEAIRLFHVSTWDAANRGGLAGAEGFSGVADLDELRKIESQIKQRFAIGTQVSSTRIVDDLLRQRFPENSVVRVLNIMVMRGELEHRLQGKILYRVH